jgi:hypothetical protein
MGKKENDVPMVNLISVGKVFDLEEMYKGPVKFEAKQHELFNNNVFKERLLAKQAYYMMFSFPGPLPCGTFGDSSPIVYVSGYGHIIYHNYNVACGGLSVIIFYESITYVS